MKFFSPKVLLHLEGLAILAAAGAAYAVQGASWWTFAILFLAPDLTIAGYAFGVRIGTAAYNLGHTYAMVGAFWLIGHFTHASTALPFSLIWLAHIGFDRLLGYGLKYPTAFKDTHLSRV
ncbi:MAG TPA: DUF4260 domain-containing protein [Lacunisphaera sp.]|jgi:hypothetical protein